MESASLKGKLDLTRWPLFLLMGCLSMFYAEIFSGSSGIWFIDFFALIITFWLYLSHVVLFLNLAMRLNKTGPIHLYIFGVFFGLYESWVTQVLWYGYYNANPAEVNIVAGVAIMETILLIFFWHPVFSFVLPVMAFQIFALQATSKVPLEERIFVSHLRFLLDRPSNRKLFFVLVLIGSLFQAANYAGDLVKVLIVLTGSYGLIYLFKAQADKKCMDTFSIKSLRLPNMTGLIVYIGALYVGMFYLSGVLNSRIPNLEGLFVILLIYVLFALVVAKTNPIEEKAVIPAEFPTQCFSEPVYRRYMEINIGLAILVCILMIIVPVFIVLSVLVIYLSMIGLGAIMIVQAIRVRNINQIEIGLAMLGKISNLGGKEQVVPLQNKRTSTESAEFPGIVCPKCGRENKMSGISFCIYCGEKMK